MNDPGLVCVLHRAAGRVNEPDALLERGLAALAMDVDGFAIDVLHDEVRRAIRGLAPIEQAGDAGVGQVGEELSFVAQSRENVGTRERPADELDRDFRFVLGVIALGEVDRTHATMADLTDQSVGADPLPDTLGLSQRDHRLRGAGDRGHDEVPVPNALVRVDERLDLGDEVRFVGRSVPKPAVARLRRDRGRGFEKLFDPSPALRRHHESLAPPFAASSHRSMRVAVVPCSDARPGGGYRAASQRGFCCHEDPLHGSFLQRDVRTADVVFCCHEDPLHGSFVQRDVRTADVVLR